MAPHGLPARRISPPSGRSSSPATCSRVDLPAPDGPTSATISPDRSASDAPRSTGSFDAAWLNVRSTARSSSDGASLIAQRLDRIEPRRAPRRIERREERQRKAHADDEDNFCRIDLGRKLAQEIDLL